MSLRHRFKASGNEALPLLYAAVIVIIPVVLLCIVKDQLFVIIASIVAPAVIGVIILNIILRRNKKKRAEARLTESAEKRNAQYSKVSTSREGSDYAVDFGRKAPRDYKRILECIETAHRDGDDELVLLSFQGFFSLHSQKEIPPQLLEYGFESSMRLRHYVTAYNVMHRIVEASSNSPGNGTSGLFDKYCLLGLIQYYILCDPIGALPWLKKGAGESSKYGEKAKEVIERIGRFPSDRLPTTEGAGESETVVLASLAEFELQEVRQKLENSEVITKELSDGLTTATGFFSNNVKLDAADAIIEVLDATNVPSFRIATDRLNEFKPSSRDINRITAEDDSLTISCEGGGKHTLLYEDIATADIGVIASTRRKPSSSDWRSNVVIPRYNRMPTPSSRFDILMRPLKSLGIKAKFGVSTEKWIHIGLFDARNNILYTGNLKSMKIQLPDGFHRGGQRTRMKNLASLILHKARNTFIGPGFFLLAGEKEAHFLHRYSYRWFEQFKDRMHWYVLLKKLGYIGTPEILSP